MIVRNVWKSVVTCAALACVVPLHAQASNWVFEVLIGDAYNFESPSHVTQSGVDVARFDGDYETRGLEGPLHYAWRIGRWQDDSAWELQLLHHKIYLRHPSAPIEALSISHGFNIITLNRAMRLGSWRTRVGVGPVVTHVEARIAGTAYDGPYELAGAAVLMGVGRELQITKHLYALAEISATYGRIEAEPDGTPPLRLDVRNPALHAQIGLGYRF